VLTGALAGLLTPALTSCTDDAAVPAGPPPPDPDVVAADRAAVVERRLLAAYDAALVLAPELAERLLPLRADHVEHLAALGLPETPEPPPADPSAGPAATPSPAPAVPAPPLPAEPGALLAALAELERRASINHARGAVLHGRGVAAVLAPLSACEASHVVALT
jgi:hypothetical protein